MADPSPFQQSINQALNQYQASVQEAKELRKQLAEQPPQDSAGIPNPAYDDLSKRLQAAEKAVTDAGERYQQAIQVAEKAAFDAALKATTPEEKAKASADADLVRAQAGNFRAAQAQTEAETALLGAKSENEKTAAQAQLTNATANLTSAGAAVTNAQTARDRLAQEAPLVAAQTAETAAGAAAITAKTPAEVDELVARAESARATRDRIKREIEAMPSGSEARAARQKELAQADATLQQTMAQVESLKGSASLSTAQATRITTLLSGEVAAQAADTEATRAGTDATRAGVEKDKLGSLYGVQDRIAEIKKLVAGGMDPAEGRKALAAYINAQLQGTDVYTASKDAATDATTRRGQDTQLAGSKTSAYGSMFSNTLDTMAGLNETVAPGSDAVGRGAVAALRLGQAGIDRNSAVPTTPQPAFLQNYATPESVGSMLDGPPPAPSAPPAGQPAPASPPSQAPASPAPAAPTTGPQQAGAPITVTINTGGQPAAGAPAASAAAPQLPEFARQEQRFGQDDVKKAYGLGSAPAFD